MKRTTLGCALATALLTAGAASAAQIVIFKQPNFTGAALTLNGDDAHLGDNGFLDQASSIVIKSGRWQLCSQPNYQGDCQVLEPGQYATLPQILNHRIESVREVPRVAMNAPSDNRYSDDRRGDDRRYTDDRRGGRHGDRGGDGRGRRWDAGSIEFFSAQSFRGRGLLLERDAARLDDMHDMYDISSVIVHEGVWEVCTDARFEGNCRTYAPGRYPTLGRFDNRVASVRRIG